MSSRSSNCRRRNGIEDYINSLSCPMCNLRFQSKRRTSALEDMIINHITKCSMKQQRKKKESIKRPKKKQSPDHEKKNKDDLDNIHNSNVKKVNKLLVEDGHSSDANDNHINDMIIANEQNVINNLVSPIDSTTSNKKNKNKTTTNKNNKNGKSSPSSVMMIEATKSIHTPPSILSSSLSVGNKATSSSLPPHSSILLKRSDLSVQILKQSKDNSTIVMPKNNASKVRNNRNQLDQSPIENNQKEEMKTNNAQHKKMEVKSIFPKATSTKKATARDHNVDYKDKNHKMVNTLITTKPKEKSKIRKNNTRRKNSTYDDIKERRKDDSNTMTCPVCLRTFNRLNMSLTEMNSHVMMCSDAQHYYQDIENDHTSSAYSTAATSTSSSSPHSSSSKASKRKGSPCNSSKLQQNIISHDKRKKRIHDPDEYMKRRTESIQCLRKDGPAKRALELILLNHLS